MAKCFIRGQGLVDRNGKSACLKIYRDQDEKELSIAFDNSLGAMGDECKRIEACIFNNEYDTKPSLTMYVNNSLQLSTIIYDFVVRGLY